MENFIFCTKVTFRHRQPSCAFSLFELIFLDFHSKSIVIYYSQLLSKAVKNTRKKTNILKIPQIGGLNEETILVVTANVKLTRSPSCTYDIPNEISIGLDLFLTGLICNCSFDWNKCFSNLFSVSFCCLLFCKRSKTNQIQKQGSKTYLELSDKYLTEHFRFRKAPSQVFHWALNTPLELNPYLNHCNGTRPRTTKFVNDHSTV